MARLLIDGASTHLGRRVAEVAARSGLDVDPDPAPGAVGAGDRVVVLAPESEAEVDGTGVGGVDLPSAAEWFSAARSAGARSVVVLSSAMVYGAWPDNPVPLTEDAVLRPNPGCRFALAKAELERMAAELATDQPALSVAILRPTLTVVPDSGAVDWLARSLWHTPTVRHGHADPGRQFLHADDLARAVVLAAVTDLRGAYNVAPEGWIAAPGQLALAGRSGGVRVPENMAEPVASTRWRFRLTSTPPDVVPYTMHPWVVSADRLRAAGWEPQFSNEEAFVVGHRESWWASLSARRRQEISLAAFAGGLTAVGGGVVLGLRGLARRPRR